MIDRMPYGLSKILDVVYESVSPFPLKLLLSQVIEDFQADI